MVLALAAFALLALTACTGNLTPSGGWASPVITEDGILTADRDGNLVLLNVESGSLTPQIERVFPNRQGTEGVGKVYGTPLVTDDGIYMAAYDCRGDDCEANVVALDRETRGSLWSGTRQYNLDSSKAGDRNGVSDRVDIKTEVVGDVALEGDTLLIGTSKVEHGDSLGYLIAVDATRGSLDSHRVKWLFPVEERIWSSPKIVDGVAYFTAMDGYVYAVDLADGISVAGQVDTPQDRLLWRFKADGALTATPVIEDGKLYVGDFEGNFYALDLEVRAADTTGQTLATSREWKFDGGSWFWARGVIDGEIVYVSTVGGQIRALDKATGVEIWSRPAQIDGEIIGTPTIFLGPAQPVSGERPKRLAVPSGSDDVWVIDPASGEQLGKFTTQSGVKSSPVATDELLFVHTLDRELQWFSLADRARLGCLKLNSGEICG